MQPRKSEIPRGLCQCGCGEATKLATRTRPHLGTVAGQPLRYLQGHASKGVREPLSERLSRYSEVRPDGCIEWVGARSPDGYGRIAVNRVAVGAHRVAYELVHGAIPDDLVVDHLCRNRSCINPEHLELVTNRENILRGDGLAAQNARKTHCINGHPLTPENIYGYDGSRECRLCARARARRQKARMRDAEKVLAHA